MLMMKQLALFFLLFIPMSLFAQTPELIFNSGFEPSVDTIEHDSSSLEIIGVDASVSAPNDWENDLEDHPNIGYHKVQFQGGDETDRLAEIVADPTNPANNALQYWILNPNSGNNGRVQGNIYNNNGLHDIFYKTRLFLPSDFNLLKNAPFDFDFMTIMEFWNNANWTEEDYMYRIKVNLAKIVETPDSLRIRITGEIRNTETNKWDEDVFNIFNTNFVVPVQKWMTCKVYFREGDDCSGRFILTITPDGEAETIVHNVRNFTHHPDDPSPDGLSHFNPMKLYTDEEIVDYVRNQGGLLNVFWDDFEFWKDSVLVTNDACLSGGYTFSTQDQIDDFSTNYPDCKLINGDVTIQSSGTQITSLAGLSQLTSIQGNLTIQSNNSLTDLSGLENITCVNGFLKIANNSTLADISALSKIRSIDGYLEISNNGALPELYGLEKLGSIDGDLTISSNGSLDSLVGLGAIDYNTIGQLFLTNSASLSYCELENICNFLMDGGSAMISGNATGCSNQAEVDAACLLLLPVELIEFTGRKSEENVHLMWKTASELDNDYFDIEHSNNGRNFKTIGTVFGSGTTDEQISYQFVHKNVKSGMNYYRLKQVDFDGQFEYSKIISIQIANDNIIVSPNPTNGIIEIKGTKLRLANLKMTDSRGRIIETNILTNNQTIDISNQPNGLYFLIIQTERSTIVRRIIKG